jgi:hypothetical protein
MDVPCNLHKRVYNLLERRCTYPVLVILEIHIDAEMATQTGLLIHVSPGFLIEIKNPMADHLHPTVSAAFLMFPIPTYMHRHLFISHWLPLYGACCLLREVEALYIDMSMPR